MVECVGTIKLGNKVDITDPCYDKDVLCRMTVDCEPGEYTGYVDIVDEEEWGKRVNAISIFKNDENRGFEDMERIGTIGVDAGMAGFFNNKPDFDDKEWSDFCNKTYDGEAWNFCNGIFSQSGYGDGEYEVFANEERNAFTIVFIEDEI